MTVACIELAPLSLTIVLAWKAGAWTFAVYAHYDRGRFYNAHPRVFVSYRGGHNRVHGSHYDKPHLGKQHTTPWP
jgi:hypothetical protein